MSKISYEEVEEEQIKDYLPNVANGFVYSNGCLLPSEYMNYGEQILEFDVNEDDIYVVSFPKCGTTWTQEMVWCIKNNFDFATAKSTPISKRYPFLELTAIKESLMLSPDSNSLEYARNFPSPRFIKSHLPLSLLPRQLQIESRKAKIIYVCRDPRDACVSFFYHHKLFYGYTENLSAFIKRFLNDSVLWTPYWKHILEFWNIKPQNNILFITYEQMKSDISVVIKKVAKFLNVDITEDQTKLLKEHLHFDNMKNNPAVNYEEAVRAANAIKGSDGKFMRSGKCKGYLKEFSKEEIEVFNDWIEEHQKGTDFNMFQI